MSGTSGSDTCQPFHPPFLGSLDIPYYSISRASETARYYGHNSFRINDLRFRNFAQVTNIVSSFEGEVRKSLFRSHLEVTKIAGHLTNSVSEMSHFLVKLTRVRNTSRPEMEHRESHGPIIAYLECHTNVTLLSHSLTIIVSYARTVPEMRGTIYA